MNNSKRGGIGRVGPPKAHGTYVFTSAWMFTREAETRALFGHFRAVPLCHGRAPGADARPDALGGTATRGTAAAEPFSAVSRLELSARRIPTR